MDRKYEHEQYGHKIVYPFLENDYEAITVVNEIKWGSNIHNLYFVFFTTYILMYLCWNSFYCEFLGIHCKVGKWVLMIPKLLSFFYS